MLKIHNVEYYESNILTLFKPVKATPDDFINSNYTTNKYQKECMTFKTWDSQAAALSKCVAINTFGGYIVKQYKDTACHDIVYREVKDIKSLGVVLGCTKCKIELNESDKQQLKNQKKKVENSKSYSPISIIQKSCVAERLVYFNGTSIFTDSNEVLQLFRPPSACEYDKVLIEDYMRFIESRVIHPEALREEFASHAYRFRNKRAFIEKFFIHYDPAGQSGKSFIFNAFEQIYGKDYAINADPKKILNDQFDSWKTKKLLVWMEEAEPNKRQTMNYDEMKAAVKRLTTRSTAARGMYEENKSAENAAIVGFNTNDETLFGLVRADQATIDRLVIIEFKRDGSKVDWVKMANKYLENPNFAYSLYKYLC